MLKPRIIACLDVQGENLVKGVRFEELEQLGDPLPKAQSYETQGIDELVIYEIAASVEERRIASEIVRRIAKAISIPLSVAGGIKSLADAEAVLSLGVDKISINTAALLNPQLVTDMAEEFGTQCVVVGVDCAWVNDTLENCTGVGDQSEVFLHAGSKSKRRSSGRRTQDWVKEVAERGAGEVVINSIDRDGTASGYDIRLLKELRLLAPIPLIASGGAQVPEHFYQVFKEAQVDGALLAGALHRGQITVAEIKNYLKNQGVAVR